MAPWSQRARRRSSSCRPPASSATWPCARSTSRATLGLRRASGFHADATFVACATTHPRRRPARSFAGMFIRAGDGTQLYVRHVRPADKDLIAAAWLELSPDSQRKRFLAPKPRLTKADLRYLTEID